ncbi:unnamed protein product [Phytophthora fragariaefolia]|uniref:Unnamed protein product n=1 Tax=Phytophthora fragariaefolia TaxID=1490495 RepID=A0A9W6U087_9STRA|nr:unnamed protein product [Phytophthora fragariaefolia]
MHLPREVVFFDPRQRVYLSHVNLSGWRVTDASLLQLQAAPPSIQENGNLVKSSFHTLTVDGSAHISVKGLRIMFGATAEGGGTLRVLRLSQCQLLSRGGGERLEGNSLPRSLTELDVSSCEWVDDGFLRTVARHCFVLAQVSLARCRQVTDYGVAAFGESYSASLTHLDVNFCTKLTDTALLALLVGSSSGPAIPGGAQLPSSSASARIRILNAAGLPLVDGLTLFGLRGPCASHLESLDMSGCTVLRVAALERLARVRAFTHLTKLDLSRCSLVDDQALSAFGKACLQLETLLLIFCSSITDIGICRLVGGKVNLPGVRTDDQKDEDGHVGQGSTLGEYENSDDEDIGGSKYERGCIRLRTLDITGCFQVTSRGISALGARCTQLESLTLDGVRRLNSSGVRALLHGCCKLRALRWSGILVRSGQNEAATPGACAAFYSIPHLSDATVAMLTSTAGSLKTLHIGTTECDVDSLALALLRARNSPLTDLDVTSLATDSLCEAIGSVLQGCPRLRVLELESCEQICDETLVAISGAPCCPQLETLVLANDWQITDIGRERLPGGCAANWMPVLVPSLLWSVLLRIFETKRLQQLVFSAGIGTPHPYASIDEWLLKQNVVALNNAECTGSGSKHSVS